MNCVFDGTLAVTITPSLLFVFGAAFLFKPSCSVRTVRPGLCMAAFNLFSAFQLYALKRFSASQIRGFRSLFEFQGIQDHSLYYEIMYYGATDKAIFYIFVLIFYTSLMIRKLISFM